MTPEFARWKAGKGRLPRTRMYFFLVHVERSIVQTKMREERIPQGYRRSGGQKWSTQSA